MKALMICFFSLLVTGPGIPATTKPALARTPVLHADMRVPSDNFGVEYRKGRDTTQIFAEFLIADPKGAFRIAVVGEHVGQARTSPDSLFLVIESPANTSGKAARPLLLHLDNIEMRIDQYNRWRRGEMVVTVFPVSVDYLLMISAAKSAKSELGSLKFQLNSAQQSDIRRVADYFKSGEGDAYFEVPQFTVSYDNALGASKALVRFSIRNEAGHILSFSVNGMKGDASSRKGAYELELTPQVDRETC